MTPGVDLYRARIIASIAAVVISLACGTNYVYSAWAPQFAERLHLSSTESNLIGLFGNLGMYSLGVPVGIFVDTRGPRPAVIAGSLLLALGYFPLHEAYDKASGSVALLCLFSYISGLGSCMAFAGAVKTSALNWPHHRGTATAFPLAAFGLSAFFFSALGSLFFPGDPSDFLMLLSIGTCGMTFAGFFFLKVYPQSHTHYRPISASDNERRLSVGRPEPLRRTPSKEAKARRDSNLDIEPGTSSASSSIGPAIPTNDNDMDESSSLVSNSDVVCTTPNEGADLVGTSSVDLDRSRRVDIRGFKLLRSLDFWQLFLIMGILSGIGLMTINNIGNDAKALWEKYDLNVSEDFLVLRQQMHVSILSICSFLGRLSSGVGSDFLVKNLHASRVWCLFLATIVFLLAQLGALLITNPHFLIFVSSLSGLGYGFLFGVFPSIVAESFGIRGLSQNWGFMTLSPVISSNIFNIFYGRTYDRHSIVRENGERLCMDGLDCYKSAYWVTFWACVTGLGVCLWVIRYQHLRDVRDNDKGDEED